jgi:DNA-binding PucR family transcriptional regulator
VLRVLDHGGQLTTVATELGIHVTTVRYRLHRAAELTGLDLTDPDVRLATHLQLRAMSNLMLHPSQSRA